MVAGKEEKMIVTIGKEGLTKTWQLEFQETTKCCQCGGVARIGFVAHEDISEEVVDKKQLKVAVLDMLIELNISTNDLHTRVSADMVVLDEDSVAKLSEKVCQKLIDAGVDRPEVKPRRVYEEHSNESKGGLWLHGRCAVAVYFCRECLSPTALYNQG